MSEKKNRKSNIELMRIIAAIGVIILHYNNTGMGAGLLYVHAWSINELILMLLESIFVCAVNLFILLSGFFLSRNKTVDLLRPLNLIIQVITFSVVFYMGTVIAGINSFSMRSLAKCFIPNNWFVILYVSLFIISPYINLFLGTLTHSAKKKLIVVLSILFFVYPTAVDVFSLWIGYDFMGLSSIGMYGSQSGYTIVNFVLMYIIGDYLRDEKEENILGQLLKLLVVIGAIFVWSLVDNAVLHTKHSSWAYCNPLVVIEAVLVFKIFRSIYIPDNKLINWLGAASFSVYLLHTKVISHVHTDLFVVRSPLIMIAHMFVCCLGLYLASAVLYEIYNRVIGVFNKIISRHWKKHRYISV